MHFSLKDILKFSAWVMVILFLLAIIVTFFLVPERRSYHSSRAPQWPSVHRVHMTALG
jgi:hypothetical protein